MDEEKTISIDMDKKQLRYWDVETQHYRIEAGIYKLLVGGSSEDIRLSSEINL